MNLLGIFLGKHDSNISLAQGKRVRYRKSERQYGIKHHRASMSWVEETLKEWGNPKIDAVAFTDGNRNNLGSCRPDELFKKTDLGYCLDHHFAHALSVWPVCDKVDVSISIDGKGDNFTSTKVLKGREIIYQSTDDKISHTLTEIGSLMKLQGQGLDLPGKIMGLQAYGKARIDSLKVRLNLLQSLWDDKLVIAQPNFFKADNPEFLNWLATIHQSLETFVVRLFKTHCKPDDVVSFTGGCAQNSVFNWRLKQEFPNLVIPPHVYDGGLSLGCIEFLRQEYSLEPFDKTDFPFWQDDPFIEAPESVEPIVDALCQGKIVGLMYGKGEIGPRALGHRSILMSAEALNGKETMNSKVKFREAWRPYAASVLKERASEYFAIDESPYMLYAVPVLKEGFPAITHVDKTSRIQTVTEENSLLYDVLKMYESKTGVPMLLNTSLNIQGGPIVSNEAQALELFKSTGMDVLCSHNIHKK